MKLVLQHFNSVILILVAVRASIQLARHRGDLALRVLVPGLVCIAVAATVNISGSPLNPVVERLLGATYRTFVDALWITMGYCFATFFAMADSRRPVAARIRTAQRGLLVVVAAITIAALLPYLAPYAFERRNGVADYRTWPRIVYSMIVDGLGLTFVSIGLVRAARYLRALTHSWLGWSVRLVMLGALGMAIVDLSSVAKMVVRVIEGVDYPKRYALTSALYLPSLIGGQTALAVGLVLPTIAAVVARINRRREQRVQARLGGEMEPLWVALSEAFPYVVLPTQPDEPDVPLNGTFDRRTTEITDALAQLAPYYTAGGLDPVHANTGMHDTAGAAAVILAALRAHASGAERAEPPFPRIEPDHASWRERSRWMVGTSRAFELLQSTAHQATSIPS
jgi:hypothetical protein